MHSIVDLTFFTGGMTSLHLMTEFKLCEFNFAPRKLPLNRVHRDDFPDLKPTFIPKLHQKTVIYANNCFNILKNTLHRPHKDTPCTNVNNKRNIN